MRALRHLLVRDKERLCAALEADVGKSLRDGLAGDVVPLAEECRFLERFAAGILRPSRVPVNQPQGRVLTVYDAPGGAGSCENTVTR